MSYRQEQVAATTKTIRVCDRCQKDAARNGMRGDRCPACGRDLCWKCSTADRRDFGDYPPSFCNECWVVGESSRMAIREEEDRSDEACERITNEWYDRCKGLRS